MQAFIVEHTHTHTERWRETETDAYRQMSSDMCGIVYDICYSGRKNTHSTGAAGRCWLQSMGRAAVKFMYRIHRGRRRQRAHTLYALNVVNCICLLLFLHDIRCRWRHRHTQTPSNVPHEIQFLVPVFHVQHHKITHDDGDKETHTWNFIRIFTTSPEKEKKEDNRICHDEWMCALWESGVKSWCAYTVPPPNASKMHVRAAIRRWWTNTERRSLDERGNRFRFGCLVSAFLLSHMLTDATQPDKLLHFTNNKIYIYKFDTMLSMPICEHGALRACAFTIYLPEFDT